MIAARNRSSHTYNEKTANELSTAILSSFVPRFVSFQAKFRELERSDS